MAEGRGSGWRRMRPVGAHGDVREYWAGCRCDPCRAANADYQREARGDRAERARFEPWLVPHRTAGGVENWRCRCAGCRGAKSVANRVARG